MLWCRYNRKHPSSTTAKANMKDSRIEGGEISAHLLVVLANGEAFLMNSTASEEDESI